jgi:D-lyxose ketol-isomerase
MLRSEINAAIDYAKATLREHRITLPPFGFWTPAEWAGKGDEYDEIRTCRLGWDVTDFGSNDFERIGLTVFTARNGHPTIEPYRRTVYCEKVLIVREGQRTPMHCHARKQEDIIVRAGGNLICQVYRRGPDGRLDAGDVVLSLDGSATRVPAGYRFVLPPGDSIRLMPLVYHEFYAAPGTGTSVVGEISTVNDDTSDNLFLDAPARFPAIVEDTAPLHLLCTEYER